MAELEQGMSSQLKHSRQHPYKQGKSAILPARKLLLEQFFRNKKLSSAQNNLKKQIIDQLWRKSQCNKSVAATPHSSNLGAYHEKT